MLYFIKGSNYSTETKNAITIIDLKRNNRYGMLRSCRVMWTFDLALLQKKVERNFLQYAREPIFFFFENN